MLIRDSKTYWILTFTICALLTTAVEGQSIIYVDANATGVNNGSSWVDAYNYLQDALGAAASGDEIWVAESIYRPAGSGGSRTSTFQLINGVALYGGFPPEGGAWEDRDPDSHETILSGDLNGNDVGNLDDQSRDENTYRVVTASNCDANTILDGFTVISGNAHWYIFGGGGMYIVAGSPTVKNCTFIGNSTVEEGGGVLSVYSSPTLTNCKFSRNNGSGMYNRGGNAALTDCLFMGNDNSGMYNSGGISILNNCTLFGNIGHGINNFNSSATLTNCILWHNVAGTQAALYYGTPEHRLTVTYSNVQGGQMGVYVGGLSQLDWGHGNIDIDPLLTPDGHLRAGSPCIDAGDNTAISSEENDFKAQTSYSYETGACK